MTFGYRGPSIDHSLLSPSGRMSKRARKAAIAREGRRLFADLEPHQETEQEKLTREIDALKRSARNLLDLAARGMKPKAYPKEAAKLLALANQLEGKK